MEYCAAPIAVLEAQLVFHVARFSTAVTPAWHIRTFAWHERSTRNPFLRCRGGYSELQYCPGQPRMMKPLPQKPRLNQRRTPSQLWRTRWYVLLNPRLPAALIGYCVHVAAILFLHSSSWCNHYVAIQTSSQKYCTTFTDELLPYVQKRKSLKDERKAKKAARSGEKPFQVDSSVRDALEGDKLTPNQVFEGQVILALGAIFSLCLVEGFIVAASVCFLPG